MAGCCDTAPKPTPVAQTAACCGGAHSDTYTYGHQPFEIGAIDTFAGSVPRVATDLSRADVRDGWKVRWNVGRADYRVRPGLYAVGDPDDTAPVLVSANYKLSFDALRRELGGSDAWILVLDTRGVNVWCAAGKGTFGTAEVIARVREVNLAQVVSHNVLVLPQLGAPGVAAHEVRAACGFRVTYGPVRAADIPAFLAAGMKATPEMRAVTFTLRERLVLAPVELSFAWQPLTLAVVGAALLIGGIGRWGYSVDHALARGAAFAGAGMLALVAGTVVTPVLLPWLPGRQFSVRGAAVGLVASAGVLIGLAAAGTQVDWMTTAWFVPGVTALASFAAMNFTGSSTFTSLSGVLHEMRRALPWQVGGGLASVVVWLLSAFVGRVA